MKTSRLPVLLLEVQGPTILNDTYLIIEPQKWYADAYSVHMVLPTSGTVSGQSVRRAGYWCSPARIDLIIVSATH